LREPLTSCSSLTLLLLSCVVPCCQGTADTRRAGSSLPHVPLRRPSPFGQNPEPEARKSLVCTLYLVFKEPRTSGVLRPFFPADCAIHFIGFCSGPFWGNLSNLRRLAFPSQSLFRFLAKKLQETFPAAQCSRPRTSRKSRRSNVGEPTPSVNPYLPTCEF